jgi:peptide/nickel transport system substrate-binding protein
MAAAAAETRRRRVMEKAVLGKALGWAALAVALLAGVAPGPALAAQTDVTIGMQLEPPNLDPTAGAAAAIDEVVYSNVFEGLTRIGSDGSVLPALAASWDISDDGLTYTFHLREGVSFHDGSAFDAEDVKFSLDRARAEDSTNAQKGLFAAIASVDAVDATTVKVTLDHPVGNFLFHMGWGDAVMVAPETAADNATHPVGTGPFKFSDWVQGDHVELTRNEDYWGEPVKLDKATFKFISDPTAAFAAVMAGDIDAFPVFPAPENLAQFEADPRFAVVVGSTEGETILAMNNGRPPFDDIKVRQAFSHAIDRQAIIDGAMFGQGTPIGSHFAPHNPAYVDLTGTYPYDPDKAKALLAEAGHGDGLTVSLKLPPPPYARRSGEIIAEQLKAIGVTAEITNLEWAQWLSEVFKGKDYDLTIVSHTEPMDIDIYARDDYYFDYHSDAFKAIMEELNNTTDPAKRDELLGDAQRKIAEDAVNVFLFELAKTGVSNAKLKGLWANSPVQANDLTGVYWED